jgi:predicted CXXCH cytochrome family protein
VKEGIDAAKAKHEPAATGDCVACHAPHRTSLDHLLLAKGSDLCLSCHKTLKAAMDGGKVHSPAARDCQRCHEPHSSAESRLMTGPVNIICAECHNPASAAFSDAHLQIDPARMRCARCHEPHASKDEHFFKPNVHAPFAMKSCQDCHLAPRARIK